MSELSFPSFLLSLYCSSLWSLSICKLSDISLPNWSTDSKLSAGFLDLSSLRLSEYRLDLEEELWDVSVFELFWFVESKLSFCLVLSVAFESISVSSTTLSLVWAPNSDWAFAASSASLCLCRSSFCNCHFLWRSSSRFRNRSFSRSSRSFCRSV